MKQIISFFVGEFHEGWVNRILHAVGLISFIVGVWELNWIVIVLGMGFMEGGHIYNYVTDSNRKLPVSIKDIAFIQFLLTIFGFAFVGLVVFLIKKVLYGI